MLNTGHIEGLLVFFATHTTDLAKLVLLLLSALAAATAFWLMRAGLQRSVMLMALTTAGFCLLDLALLAALPRLNISFGPKTVPLTVWWAARLVLFIGWVLIERWKERKESPPQRSNIIFLLLNLTLAAVLIYGFFFEPMNLGVTYLEENAEQNDLRPIRILHLTDLHLERQTQREVQLIPLVEAQQPDLILLTGDYLNLSNLDDPVSLEQARALLTKLHAPLGVYAVDGSVDSAYLMHELFSTLEITVLDNEVLRLPLDSGAVYLVGVTMRDDLNDADTLTSLMQQVPPEAFSILLYHTPDLIETAAQTGVDFYLAGHTHGGQIRIPFYGALITFSRYGKQYEMGRYELGDTVLYVSRGIGMEGSVAPRARFLCPPEITVIDLSSTEQQ